ncbi:MAG: right-handed parallel beta-helix repeat-containing protein [Bacteroidales bacterium]
MFRFFFFILFCRVLSSGFCMAFTQQKIEVTNEYELIKALGPDRTIILREGKYDLSLNDSLLRLSQYYSEDTVSFHGAVFQGLINVRFIGIGEVEIITRNYDEWVLYFKDCNRLYFENMNVGHEVPTDCEGGTACFSNSSDIRMQNVGLHGSGTTGLVLDRVTNFLVSNSEIYKCTYHLLFVTGSNNVKFIKTTFKESEKLQMLIFDENGKVSFKKCEFRDNTESKKRIYERDNVTFIQTKVANSPVSFMKCRFLNNRYEYFCNDISPIRVVSCDFINNEFGAVEEKKEFISTEEAYF